jgi:hypothetical protein
VNLCVCQFDSLFKVDMMRNEELENLLQGINKKEIEQMIEKRCVDGAADPVDLIRAIFIGSPIPAEESRRINIVLCIIKLLDKGILADTKAQKVIEFLNPELEGFEDTFFVDFVEAILQNMEDTSNTAKSCEFLPKCLEILSRAQSLPFQSNQKSGTKTTFSSTDFQGTAYKDDALDRLVSRSWPQSAIINLTGLLRDIVLTQDQLKKIAEKVIRFVFSFYYNFLIISKRNGKCRIIVASKFSLRIYSPLCKRAKRLDTSRNHGPLSRTRTKIHCKSRQTFYVNFSFSIFSHFFSVQKSKLKQLREVEGISIMSLNIAMKQDQGLGKEVLKLCKQEPSPWKPFNLGLLLTMARIQRYEEKVSPWRYLKN